MNKNYIKLLVLSAHLGGFATAQTVLIDFGTSASFRGVSLAGADTNGNYWNAFKPGDYLANLVDVTGSGTSLAIGLDSSGGTFGTDSYNGPAGATSNPVTAAQLAAVDIDANALGSLGVKEAAIDFITSTNGRIQIQNLNPAKTYRLEFFASRRFQANASTVFNVYSDSTYATSVASAVLLVQDPASPWLNNRSNVATLANLTAQSGNNLYISFGGAGGTGNGSLNALRLTVETAAIPEPAAYTTLAGICAFGVLVLRRRRA